MFLRNYLERAGRNVTRKMWDPSDQLGYVLFFPKKEKKKKVKVRICTSSSFLFFFKRNWLGYVLGNSSYGGGGLIRDHNGDWIISFSRSLGFTNSFIVELWALRDGLSRGRFY